MRDYDKFIIGGAVGGIFLGTGIGLSDRVTADIPQTGITVGAMLLTGTYILGRSCQTWHKEYNAPSIESTQANPKGLSEGSPVYSKDIALYETFSKSEDARNTIVRYLSPIIRGKTVLDICCGNGKYASLLGPLAESYVGIDSSKEALECARQNMLRTQQQENCSNNKKSIDFFCADATSLSLTTKSIAIAISTWGIGSITGDERRRAALLEAERIARNDIYLFENSADGEFQKVRGSKYTTQAIDYGRWLSQQGFTHVTDLESHFLFESTDDARRVFRAIWDQDIASRVKCEKIAHTIAVFHKKVSNE